MGKQTPKVVLGSLWADTHPQVVAALGNTYDTYVFDLFNAVKSIKDLEGSIANVFIMFSDMLDSLGSLVVELQTSGILLQHFVVIDESNSPFDAARDEELGVCARLPATQDPDEVLSLIKHVLDTCPCKPGRSRLAMKFEERSTALRKIEDNELDLAIVALVAEGHSNEEIADKVHYSLQTIRNRLSEIMKVANLSNRTELAVLWRRHMVERRMRHIRK